MSVTAAPLALIELNAAWPGVSIKVMDDIEDPATEASGAPSAEKDEDEEEEDRGSILTSKAPMAWVIPPAS